MIWNKNDILDEYFKGSPDPFLKVELTPVEEGLLDYDTQLLGCQIDNSKPKNFELNHRYQPPAREEQYFSFYENDQQFLKS